MNTLVNQNQIASEDWQKPSSWVDIRTGAQDNSIYLLVGHKADFSKYNEFPIKVNVNNTGTYDIYIDGVKKYSAVAGGTETLLNWQTLNLASGFDVTYPEALRTHIIRVTPTVSTNEVNYPKFVKSALSNVGLLWLHFTTDYTFYIPEMCYANPCNAPVLEAVTSSTGFLKTSWMESSFYNATSLKEIPIINITSGDANFKDNFYSSKIKKLEYKIDAQISSNNSSGETNLSQCEEIVNTTQYPLHTVSFANCPKLKRIRGFFSKTFPTTMGNLFGGDVSMEETFLDFSEGAQVKKLVIGGTSSVPLPWFKGLTVSASAPFDGTSPQLDVSYTGLDRGALVNLFNSMPYNVGYTVVGSPTIVDGVASGFSSSAGLQLNSAIPQNINTFEYLTKARMDETGTHGALLARVTGSEAYFAIQGNSHRFNIYNAGWIVGSTELSLQTWYWFKVIFNGIEYKGYTLQDNNYTINTLPSLSQWDLQWTTPADGKASWVKGSLCALGRNPIYTNEYLNGSIDLNNTYIKVNDVPWFRGTAAMTKTCSVVGCTGTADLTADDKAIATGKGWELTVA